MDWVQVTIFVGVKEIYKETGPVEMHETFESLLDVLGGRHPKARAAMQNLAHFQVRCLGFARLITGC